MTDLTIDIGIDEADRQAITEGLSSPFGLAQGVWIGSASVGIALGSDPVPQRALGNPERTGHLCDRALRGLDQLECVPAELVGVLVRTTHDGLLPTRSPASSGVQEPGSPSNGLSVPTYRLRGRHPVLVA